jgi:hypothetical protein
MKYLPLLWIHIFQWTKFNRIFKTWQKERFSVRLRSLQQSVKETVSPDLKCLEVESVKSPWLVHVTPDIENNLSFPFNNGPLGFLSVLYQTHSNSLSLLKLE